MTNPTPTNSRLREIPVGDDYLNVDMLRYQLDDLQSKAKNASELPWHVLKDADGALTVNDLSERYDKWENRVFAQALVNQWPTMRLIILALLDERDKLAGEVERLGKCNEDVCEANTSLRTQLSEVTAENDRLKRQLANGGKILNQAQAERDAAYEALAEAKRVLLRRALDLNTSEVVSVITAALKAAQLIQSKEGA